MTRKQQLKTPISKVLGLSLAALCLLAPIQPALAETPPSAEQLERRDIIVDLKTELPIYHLDVYGLVDGTPEQVWEAITSYNSYNEFLPLVTDSSVRKRADKTVYQYVKMNPPWPFHQQWMVNANKEDKINGIISWTMADGNVKLEHGYWAVTPMPNGKTRLQYHLTVDPWMDNMPSWVVSMVTRGVMPQVIRGVRKRVELIRSASK
jgi:ribosome-associated toxin RatA of RatAB toxin-antitoxin module